MQLNLIAGGRDNPCRCFESPSGFGSCANNLCRVNIDISVSWFQAVNVPYDDDRGEAVDPKLFESFRKGRYCHKSATMRMESDACPAMSRFLI